LINEQLLMTSMTSITKPVFALLSCLSLVLAPVKLNAVEDSDFIPVSMISLIATPEKFAGKFVVVEGIGHFDSQKSINAIFLTRNDKRAGNGRNGLFLIFATNIPRPDKLNNQYVLVRGQFRPDEKGRLSAFSASLVDVDLVKPMKLESE